MSVLTDYDLIEDVLQVFLAKHKTVVLPNLSYSQALAMLPDGAKALIDAVYNLNPKQGQKVQQDLTEYPEDHFVSPNNSVYAKSYIRVTPELLDSFLKMQKKIKEYTGRHLKIVSGYRSPVYQAILLLGGYYSCGYNMDVTLAQYMPPGYSEHGNAKFLAIDVGHIYSMEEKFEESVTYEWMISNASDFGFRLSYPSTQKVMMFEPWHWQFRGCK